jgi:4-diphosphocytidyl-2-C-methyl-D-erythritol kinase
MAVERIARAKINLALHVTGRRADGYHLLDSLVAFADFGDVVRVEAANDLSLTVTGPMAAGLSAGPDNLVLRAASVMGRGAAITLEKRLPVASGIGGGSADAAATLAALAELYGCDLPTPAQVLALGADVPVCLAGVAARMQGIGEEITPIALPPAHLVLVNPGFGLGTADVFRAMTKRDNPPMAAPEGLHDACALAAYLQLCRNDMEPAALKLAPQIAGVIATLALQPGCLLARMSGSGATCFGLFEDKDKAEAAAKALSLSNPKYWVQAAALVG